MIQRAYTVDEIDRMRRAAEVLARNYVSARGGCYSAKSSDVEDRLRTYMINGTSPEELESAAARYEAENDK